MSVPSLALSTAEATVGQDADGTTSAAEAAQKNPTPVDRGVEHALVTSTRHVGVFSVVRTCAMVSRCLGGRVSPRLHWHCIFHLRNNGRFRDARSVNRRSSSASNKAPTLLFRRSRRWIRREAPRARRAEQRFIRRSHAEKGSPLSARIVARSQVPAHSLKSEGSPWSA